MTTSHFQDLLHPPHRMSSDRIWRVTGAVVLAHLGLGWAVSHGLLTSVVPLAARDTVILASVVMDAPAPPAPALAKPKPRSPAPEPRPETPTQRPALKPTSLPTPQLQPEPTVTQAAPSVAAPVVYIPPATSNTATPTPATSGQQRPSAQAQAPVSSQVVLPSTNADYLNNAAPSYPRVSKRLGEQGTVLIRVLITTEGRAEKAEIRTSSGHARLDETALTTVQTWRFVPGTRNGVPEAMWFNVPVRFVLD
jgi:protein TonB